MVQYPPRYPNQGANRYIAKSKGQNIKKEKRLEEILKEAVSPLDPEVKEL